VSVAEPEKQPGGPGVCATCGSSITHPGPDGECARCLVRFGFLADDNESPQASTAVQPRVGPLRYAHFEVEVNADGHPKILGAGAMAVTYSARDTVLNSTVALKVISGELAKNPTARARFLREARAAAQIHHPNVARVTHYGEQDGECFYAMELVHGETLEARVQRDGPLPLTLALEVVEQTARGLAAGEACGVIHRDLKPSNLMIESHSGDQLLVKIIDYGVAKVMAAQADAAYQTQAGFIGTPAFASPEQFKEAGQQQIDTRSDIYALGVTFWYLLTGRTPFAGPSIEELRARQAEPLPLKQLKNAHVPLECVKVLESVLAFDPAKRPQTAYELVTKVHKCHIRFEPAARRRRKRAVLVSVGLALAIGFLLVASFIYQRSHASSELARAIAVLPFENLSSNPEDRFLAIGIQDEILTSLARLADLKVIARTSTESYIDKRPDLRVVGKQLAVGRVLEGSVQRSADKVRVNVQLIDTRTNAHLWANSYDRKLDDVFAVETEVANSIAQQLDATLVQRISTQPPTAITAAYNAYLRGVGIEHSQSSGNLSAEDSARAYAEAVRFDPNFALGWARLSMVRSSLYYHGVDPNVNSAAAVKEAADRALALAPELGEAWLAQGTYRWRVLNDAAAALQAYREAERLLPNSALVREYMAYTERRVSRWRDAETHLARAIGLDPRNTGLWTNLAYDILWPLGRAAEAHAAYDRALEISPDNEFVIALKAEQYQQEGRLDAAAKQLARIPKDSTDKAVLIHRVEQAVLERNFEEAIFWAKKATSSPSPGEAHNTQDIFALMLQSYCQLWAGHHEEARTTFEHVIQEVAPGGVLRTPPILGSRLYLAVAYAALGDKSNAHEQARRGVAEYENDALLQPIAEAFRARALAQLGEVDAAIDALPHLLEVPGGIHPGELRYSPYWDPLRKDPRFQALLKNPPPVRY
jgi:serine/threonine protein kinase/tetratricopeptide (TPR) repeat protein